MSSALLQITQELAAVDRGLIASFRWRQATGQLVCPKQMATRHLFYTLRMIWNHSMPKEARIEPYRRYRFGERHSPEYLKVAIVAIGTELAARDDLADDLSEQLLRMMNYFRQYRLADEHKTQRREDHSSYGRIPPRAE